MKFLTWQNIIILLLLTVFVFRECSRPEPYDLDGKAYQDSTKLLKQEKAVIQSRQHELVLAYRIRVKQDSAQLARQDSRIQVLQNRATTQRTVVEAIIQNNPALESFISTQQEIIHEYQTLTDSLKASVEFHKQMHADLIQDEYVEDKIEFQMQVDCGKRIAGLEKEVKKKRRGNKLLKIGVIALPVLALIGGTQL